MLVEVQPLGDYLDSDEQGYLINPAAWQHIPKAWHLPIEAIKQAYQDFYKDALHSLYLRGSLVRGTYRAGISDVDVLALVQGAKRWQVVPFADTLEKGLKVNFPFVQKLELMVSTYSERLQQTDPGLAMILKTQGLAIHGMDITVCIPPYRADQSMFLHSKWLAKDLTVFLESKKYKPLDSQRLMKMLIRCGFELVLEQEGKYTFDLYPAVQSFIKYYPKQAENMEKALFYYLNPKENLSGQGALILNLGTWLVKKINSL